MKGSTKEAIRRLSTGGIRRGKLGAATSYDPIAARKKTATPAPPIDDVPGLMSPIAMVITATVERSIPVPPAATEVIVLDAAAYTLTDANGVVYTVQSVTWPA
jgi:hypothetical protein